MKKNLFILIASLFLCGTISAQTAHWTCDSSPFSNSMPLSAWVTLDDNYLGSSEIPQGGYDYDIEVAAFVGEECRMTTFLKNLHSAFAHLFAYDGVAFTTAGESVTFKMYIHSTGHEYDLCDFTCVTVDDGIYNDLDNPIVLPFHTPSYKLNITGYGTNTAPSNYYLIASPVGTVNVTEVSNMTNNDFDLYYFDQAQEEEWINYNHGTGFDALVAGTGYLYANSNDVQLEFKGFYTGDGKVTLKKNLNNTNQGQGQGFEGWNLVGNPYATAATIGRSFYKMNGDATGGTGLLATAQTGSIDPMMGIFVLATTDGEEMTFTPATSKASSNMVNVELSKENGSIMDRVIVRFGDGDLLPKIQLFEGTSKIYVPQSDGDYAILNASNDGQMPVNFKAAENGNYTLVVTPENVEMEYLHLIDNLTGADVDLLTNPKYNFSANTTDYYSRFTLRFRANSSVDVNEMFCPMTYRQDGTLAINGIQGESELTIIDMLGRVVSKEAFNITDGMIRNIVATPGVYVLRLMNNNNVYTQKIVVE